MCEKDTSALCPSVRVLTLGEEGEAWEEASETVTRFLDIWPRDRGRFGVDLQLADDVQVAGYDDRIREARPHHSKKDAHRHAIYGRALTRCIIVPPELMIAQDLVAGCQPRWPHSPRAGSKGRRQGTAQARATLSSVWRRLTQRSVHTASQRFMARAACTHLVTQC